MEKHPTEQIKNELNPEELGSKFNEIDSADFISFLRNKIKENSSVRFEIIANWSDIDLTKHDLPKLSLINMRPDFI